MPDVHTKEIRSYNMSRIRSSNTKPEMLVRRFLHSEGFRFRLHYASLPGKPDLILPKYKIAIFIHGCFWHSHTNCKFAHTPVTNREYWMPKLFRNRERDKENIKDIKKQGWTVIVIWECKLKGNRANTALNNLINRISKEPVKNNK